MKPKMIKIELNPFDLEIIQKALLFLKANLDDYNDMRSEGDEPTLAEANVTAVYESIF